jgi:hypothetical protein
LAVSQENKVRHRTSVPRGPETSVGSMLQFDSLVFVGFSKSDIRPMYFLDKKGLNSVQWLQ